MKPKIMVSTMFALTLVLVMVLLAAGCVDHTSNSSSGSAFSLIAPPNEITPEQPALVPTEPKVYTVIQGEPFTYQGFVNDTKVQSVGVQINSQPGTFSPMSIPVDANGTFTLTLWGNLTKNFWDEYTYEKNYSSPLLTDSPYLHVSLNYTTKKDYFDLLVVSDANNLTSLKPDLWIQIDPLQDIIIPPFEENDYSGPFFINGTTNLNIGENLSIELSSLCFWPCGKREATDTGNIGCCGDILSYVEYTKVQGSSTGINTWSFLVNAAPNRFVISRLNGLIDDNNLFQVYVADVNRTVDDNRWDQATFVIKVLGYP